MAYIINNTRGDLIATVPDGTVNTTAIPVALVGRGVQPYGEYENENYVYILENFCNTTAPPNAMQGQLWFDSLTNTLKVQNTANVWVSVASQDYVEAAKVSPAFSGIPTAPTAANGTIDTQIATTEFVNSAITIFGASAGNTYAPINSPALTGVPTAPTAVTSDNTTKLATTAFVQAQKVDIALTGTPTAPTAVSSDDSTQIATTAFVQAQKVSPTITGLPLSTTPGASDNSTRIATTAFVQAQKIDTALTGSPTATTPNLGDSSNRIATTEFVEAQKSSPTFTGIPRAPTAPVGAANTQIATTEFVSQALSPVTGSLGTMSTQNANAVNISGGEISYLNTPLPIIAGGTGAFAAEAARTNLGIPPFPLSLDNGGTGATNAANARINLGLGNIDPSFVPGTIATQNSNAVSVTGGTITGITDIAIADGGTGASTAVQARLNLGLGNIATQASNNVEIGGGNIYGLTNPIPIASGGTGAITAAQARINLGLGNINTEQTFGTMASQNASAVNITGGTAVLIGGNISGLTNPLELASGGTGATNAANARVNLGLGNIPAGFTPGTMATQNANAVAITGGTITGVTAIPIASGGTGAASAALALTNLGGVPTTRTVVAGNGLTGGGSLASNVTLSIASSSNGYGTRTVSTSTPSGGSDGDIWYRI